jgi:microcystin-dependent protein
MCNGQVLPINQNQALFSLLGKNFGGDGIRTFALPNLQGRVPFHFGGGYTIGQIGGEQSHVLTASEQPTHTHAAHIWRAPSRDAHNGGRLLSSRRGLAAWLPAALASNRRHAPRSLGRSRVPL